MIKLKGSQYEIDLAGTNPRVAAILNDQPKEQRESFALRSFELGVEMHALGSANGTVVALGDQLKATADGMKEPIGTLAEGIKDSMIQSYAHFFGPSGILDSKLVAASHALVEQLDPKKGATVRAMIDQLRNESGKAAQMMMNEADKKLADVCKNLNINDAASPIGTLHRDLIAIKETMVKLQEQHAAQARVDSLRNRTTLKGADLEAWVGEVLAPIVSARGESLEHCAGGEGGTTRKKVGDFLVSGVGNPGEQDSPIVIEAKNSKISVALLRPELARARENRGALAALGVIACDEVKAEPIAVFDKVHVIVSLPRFGKADADYELYRVLLTNGLAVARVLARAALQPPALENVDLGRILTIVEQVAGTARLRSRLRGEATRTVTAAQKTQETAVELDHLLTDVTELLRAAIATELQKCRHELCADAALVSLDDIEPLKLATSIVKEASHAHANGIRRGG